MRVVPTVGVLAFAVVAFSMLEGAASADPGIPGAIAHWSFDDGLAITADSVGAHHGSVVGAYAFTGRSV